MIEKPSYWSVDSIYPSYEAEASSNEEIALIKMIHYTEYKTPGTRKIAIDRKLLTTKKENINFGQIFELKRGDLKDQEKEIFFKGKKHSLPYFSNKNIGFLQERRKEHLENELKIEINEFIKSAANTKAYRISDDSQSLSREKTEDIAAKILVFNVGQGDTILLELPGKELWMIDAYFVGMSRFSYNVFMQYMKENYEGFDIKKLVLSHLHHDHIRSAHNIIKDFGTTEVIFPSSLEHPSATVRNLFRECNKRGILKVLSGDEVTNFPGLKLTLKRTYDFCNPIQLGLDPNNHGIAVILETDESFALLPGDIPGHLLRNLNHFFERAKYKYRFYKVTHHCSQTGNDKSFLNILNPHDAATSCSRSNSFGHPNDPPKGIIDALTFHNAGDHKITGFQKTNCLKYFIK